MEKEPKVITDKKEKSKRKSIIPQEELDARPPDKDGKFCCLYCGFKTLFISSIFRHEATVHHVIKPWLNIITCDLCDYVVLHESEHLRHIIKHVNHPPQPSEVPFVDKQKLDEILENFKQKLAQAKMLKQNAPHQKKVHYKKIGFNYIDNSPIKKKSGDTTKVKKKRGRPKATKVLVKSKMPPPGEKITTEPKLSTDIKTKQIMKIKMEKKATIQLKSKASVQTALKKKKELLKRYCQSKKPVMKVKPLVKKEPMCNDSTKKTNLRFIDGFYHCPYCEFASTIKTSMNRHLVGQHALNLRGKVYGCKKCALRTTNRYDFYRHVISQRHKINNHIPDGVKEDLDSYVEITEEDNVEDGHLPLPTMGFDSNLVENMIDNDDDSNDSTLLNSQAVLKTMMIPHGNIFTNLLEQNFHHVKQEPISCHESFDLHRSSDNVLESSVFSCVESTAVDGKFEESLCGLDTPYSKVIIESEKNEIYIKPKPSESLSRPEEVETSTLDETSNNSCRTGELVSPLLQKLKAKVSLYESTTKNENMENDSLLPSSETASTSGGKGQLVLPLLQKLKANVTLHGSPAVDEKVKDNSIEPPCNKIILESEKHESDNSIKNQFKQLESTSSPKIIKTSPAHSENTDNSSRNGQLVLPLLQKLNANVSCYESTTVNDNVEESSIRPNILCSQGNLESEKHEYESSKKRKRSESFSRPENLTMLQPSSEIANNSGQFVLPLMQKLKANVQEQCNIENNCDSTKSESLSKKKKVPTATLR